MSNREKKLRVCAMRPRGYTNGGIKDGTPLGGESLGDIDLATKSRSVGKEGGVMVVRDERR